MFLPWFPVEIYPMKESETTGNLVNRVLLIFNYWLTIFCCCRSTGQVVKEVITGSLMTANLNCNPLSPFKRTFCRIRFYFWFQISLLEGDDVAWVPSFSLLSLFRYQMYRRHWLLKVRKYLPVQISLFEPLKWQIKLWILAYWNVNAYFSL